MSERAKWLEKPTAMCSHCGKALSKGDGPKSIRSWCNQECMDAWDKANPEEAAGWIRVERMTPTQRAELDAMLGRGKKC